MKEKRRLGRGLGALIDDASTGEEKFTELPLDRIRPNPLQPRKEFDRGKLKELADSIREHGVVQAVVVTPAGAEGYHLIAGERRCRAARMAGLSRVPALIREVDGKAMLELALIENLQREDLNPIEEARAYRRLTEEFKLTQEELGTALGKSRPAIANTIRLLALPPGVQQAIVEGKLNVGQARPLLGVEGAARQEELAGLIMKRKLTAREVERLIGKAAGSGSPKGRKTKTGGEGALDPLTRELQNSLQRQFGTRVRIGRRGKSGSIEISFYGEEDLERIIALLMPGGLA